MTVSALEAATPTRTAGDGTTKAFPTGFFFFDSTELEVLLRVNATEAETPQTAGVDYTVTGGAGSDGHAAAGTVNMTVAPASTETLVIRRLMPIEQQTDFIQNTASQAETTEQQLDKLWFAVSQLEEKASRALRFKRTSAKKDLYAEDVVADQVIVANATGDGFLFSAAVDLGVAVIGTDVQAWDAELQAIADLTSAADRLPYFTGSGTAALATFTAAGRAILDDANAGAQRTTLGLVAGGAGDIWVEKAGDSMTGNLLIGSTIPATTSPALDIVAVHTMVGSDTDTDATSKFFRMGCRHFTNSEKPFAVVQGSSNGADNFVLFGGGTSLFNAATGLRFITAADSTTVSGTERMRIDAAGNMLLGGTATPASAEKSLAIFNGTAPTSAPADSVVFYSSDESAGNTIPSFYCEGTAVLATGQADSASSVRVKARINGTVVTLLAI